MDWIDDLAPDGAPVILFGACDRHNFGDLLFPRLARQALAAARPRRPVIVAGIAGRDFTRYGGTRTVALDRLAAEWTRRFGDAPADLVHVGGQILDCGAWEAAVMLETRRRADALIRRLAPPSADPAARSAWTRTAVGPRLAPYVAPRSLFANPGRWIFAGVGGADLGHRCEAFRAEVFVVLRDADHVGVRDRATRDLLAAAGIAASLEPDPVSARPAELAALIAEATRRRVTDTGLPPVDAGSLRLIPPSPSAAELQTSALPNADLPTADSPTAERRTGYVAVQLAAACGDDRTLGALAGALVRLADAKGWRIVVFRAGAAPWHDDPAVCRRLVDRIGPRHGHLFASLDVRRIAALVAGARAYVGSSLHGRIVAALAGIPRVSLRVPGGGTKIDAWIDTWDAAAGPAVDRDAIAAALARASP